MLTKIANAIGISRQAVDKCVKRGMPVTSIEEAIVWREKNIDPVYNRIARNTQPTQNELTPQPVANLERVEFAEAKRRREVAQAQLAEVELAEKSGELVPAALMKSKWFEVTRKVRDDLLTIPGRVCNLCVGLPALEVKSLITKEIEAALDRLAGPPEM